MNSTETIDTPVDEKSSVRRSFLLVFACTLIGAAAQMFIKSGTGQLGTHVTLVDVAHDPTLILKFGLSMVANKYLFCGYALYGVNTVLIAVALKGRELSRLFPIIALTYVWVTLLSLFVLGEHMNFFRAVGIAFIVIGVSVLGLKSSKAPV